MAWVATENFESYSAGALAGNNGGSGWTSAWTSLSNDDWQVGTTTVCGGSKNAVDTVTSGDATSRIYRDFAALSGTTNEVQFYLAASSATTDNIQVQFANSSSASRIEIQMGEGVGGGGDIELVGATSQSLATSFSANTCYLVTVDIDVTNSRARAKLDGGAYTSYVSLANSGDITRLILTASQEGTGANTSFYFDEIGPVGGAAATTLLSRRMRMGIGS